MELYHDICNFDVILLSYLFPTKKSSHAGAGRKHGEDWVMKEVWEERGPAKWRCDLAQGGKLEVDLLGVNYDLI